MIKNYRLSIIGYEGYGDYKCGIADEPELDEVFSQTSYYCNKEDAIIAIKKFVKALPRSSRTPECRDEWDDTAYYIDLVQNKEDDLETWEFDDEKDTPRDYEHAFLKPGDDIEEFLALYFKS